MNGNNFRMPARRFATVAAATALAAGPAALAGAGSAHATDGTGEQGSASAVVLRTGLDVSLLNKTVNVPLTVSLNEVRAPRSSEKTALTARLEGVDGGQPFSVLGAEVAAAKATVSAQRPRGTRTSPMRRSMFPGFRCSPSSRSSRSRPGRPVRRARSPWPRRICWAGSLSSARR